jgi:hypothetical protein
MWQRQHSPTEPSAAGSPTAWQVAQAKCVMRSPSISAIAFRE